ncbi:MAG TPA: redox-sensing transcriptional repressor Rex [Candidatus Aminicenantes bacterium]|nr:redox-sensing transcriptional repressor Rex [Candidatus Aminicenantes bacterium]
MAKNKVPKVSVPVMRRLPVYHHFLTGLAEKGIERVSSTTVAHQFGYDPIKVRKDLALTGAVGRPRVGFVTRDLLKHIEAFLGWSQSQEAVLAGCGALGSALLGYEGFSQCGWEILVAFDKNPDRVGSRIHGKPVMPLESLSEVCRRMKVQVGIITAPAKSAQKIADMMVDAGLRGIWNFAPTSVQVPEGVILQQENLLASLTILGLKLKFMKSEQKPGLVIDE